MIQETLNSYGLHLEVLRRLVSDLDDTQMVCQPPNMPNHPAWTIGHLAFSLQQMAGECGLSPWLPEDWESKFGTGSNPVSEIDAYLDKASLLQFLEDSKERLWTAIRSLSESGLGKPLPDVRYRDRFPTVGHAVVHILSGHTALHLGQLTVWRRLMGLKVASEPSNEPSFVITPETPISPDAANLIAASPSVLRQDTTIIPMTTKHVLEVIELWEETEGLILTPTDNALDLDRYFCHNPGMSHVAIRNGRIVGAVLCGYDGRRGYLHHLAVADDVRNQGIGRTLVNACLSKLREVGIRQCNLFVIDDHAEGRQFWMNDKWEEWPNIRLMSKKIDEM